MVFLVVVADDVCLFVYFCYFFLLFNTRTKKVTIVSFSFSKSELQKYFYWSNKKDHLENLFEKEKLLLYCYSNENKEFISFKMRFLLMDAILSKYNIYLETQMFLYIIFFLFKVKRITLILKFNFK